MVCLGDGRGKEAEGRHLYGRRMNRKGSRCIFALELCINEDYVGAPVLLQSKSKGKAGGPCTDDEDLCSARQGHEDTRER